MGVTNSNKEIDTQLISCAGSLRIRLSLTAEPDITSNPADIVLILDRSGSMTQSLDSMKDGANAFIDIIDEATDGTQDGQIGSGSRIGIVSFSDTATQDTQLITSVADLKAAVDALTADGSTNHEDAFTKALELFDPASTNAKVMVMFTDGVTTAGGDANTVATLAKSQGVIIYCIGLSGNGGIDEQALRDWASDPDSAYVAITPNDEELEELFENLARNISNPGATEIVITDVVSDCFRVTSLSSPTKGTARMLDSNTVEWQISELGVTQSEGATFEFEVEHNGVCSGTIPVNESITYEDAENNVVTFPSPEVEVECGIDVCPEPCSDPVEITAEGCSDTVEFDAGEIGIDGLGKIVKLSVTVKNVCPNKRVALAALLYEVDACGHEYKRGVKIVTIPAHMRENCQDINVKCLNFVIPDESCSLGEGTARCGEKKYRARFITNYIDNDFDCCCCDTQG